MSDQEIRRLEGYDLKSITRADDCDCYDAILTPRPHPEVRVRIRKEDLIRLANAIASNENGRWELDIDCGTLYEVVEDNRVIPIGLKHLVAAEIYGEDLHYYGYHRDDK